MVCGDTGQINMPSDTGQLAGVLCGWPVVAGDG